MVKNKRNVEKQLFFLKRELGSLLSIHGKVDCVSGRTSIPLFLRGAAEGDKQLPGTNETQRIKQKDSVNDYVL